MILLSAGHYPEAPGACFPDNNPHWCEHAESVSWVNRMAILIRQQMPVSIVPTGPLAVFDKITKKLIGGKVFWINEQCRRNEINLAIELHFNSDASKKQHGSETLFCPGSIRGEMLANIVQGAIASIFPPNRGPKEGWYRMDKPGHEDYPGDIDGDEKKDYFLEKTICPALIIEPEFIYNRSAIEANRDIACEIIANAILEAATHH